MSKSTPTVRWNEKKQRWMAFVRFPDGSRCKIERVDRAMAESELSAALVRRSEVGTVDVRSKVVTFAVVAEAWLEAGAPALGPKVRHVRPKGPKTVKQARIAMTTHVLPAIGQLHVDRTSTATIEAIFETMDARGLSRAWVNKVWQHLNSAIVYGQRKRLCKTNPAADALLPLCRPPKERRSLTIEQARHLIVDVLPTDRRPAMWLLGLTCGLRPGELFGVRWPFLDIDSDRPAIAIDERADYDGNVYIGQAAPKGGRNARRTIELHPLVAAALQVHRDEQFALGRYDPNGFVFVNRDGRRHSPSGGRALLKTLFRNAGFGDDWTTYELRHSFVTLAKNELRELQAIADAVGHVSTRTTEGYAHNTRPIIDTARRAWVAMLEPKAS